jgi:hypothetical protein
MNLINIMQDKSDIPPKTLILSAVYGIWDIARNKIITLPIYVIYSKQAKDKDLLKFINKRIDTVRKQISMIQQFLKDYDLEGPQEPNWEKKLNNDPFVLSTSIIDDEEIAMSMREHIRSVLGIETEALRNAVIPETRNLIFSLLKKGNDDYAEIIELQKEKKWTDNPPTLIQQ